MKTKEYNDYSVFIAGGVTQDNHLHVLDMIRGKWEAPELEKNAVMFWNRFKRDKTTGIACNGLYIEDKSSGTPILQRLKALYGIPVIGVKPEADKLTRVEGILPYIESGQVYLPENEYYGFVPDLLSECEAFNRELTQAHDDICFAAGTKIATIAGDKNIEDIKEGDYVITPFGINKVIKSQCTGMHKVISKFGLIGTPEHKIFANGQFDKLGNLSHDAQVDTLTYRGLLKWTYKKILYLMEYGISSWERKDIILVNQIQMQDEKILKDFMLRFGNIIAGRKYLKAMLYTIKTVIALIMTTLIWNVYQSRNILKFMLKKQANALKRLKHWNIWIKSDRLQKNGMQAQKGINGIKNMYKEASQRHGLSVKKEFAKVAEKNILQKQPDKNIVVKHVDTDITCGCEDIRKVYNITVEHSGVYYANNILVSNCDSLVYLTREALAKNEVSLLDYFM